MTTAAKCAGFCLELSALRAEYESGNLTAKGYLKYYLAIHCALDPGRRYQISDNRAFCSQLGLGEAYFYRLQGLLSGEFTFTRIERQNAVTGASESYLEVVMLAAPNVSTFVETQAKKNQKRAKKQSSYLQKGVSPALPKACPDQFVEFWNLWQPGVMRLIDRPEDRMGAAIAWGEILEELTASGEYEAPEAVAADIVEGTDTYIKGKKYQKDKGERSLAIPHGCRYLRGKVDNPTPYWKVALDYKREKEAKQQAITQAQPAIDAATIQAAADQQRQALFASVAANPFQGYKRPTPARVPQPVSI